jgi:hypothetical protein
MAAGAWFNTEGDLKKLYSPDYFYEHGDNPAHKKLIEVASANVFNGEFPEWRSHIFDNKARWLMARNFDDLLHRDFKIYTAPRALAVFTIATLGLVNVVGACNRLLPVGQFGITKMSQTPFYHRFGRGPAWFVRAIPYIGSLTLISFLFLVQN